MMSKNISSNQASDILHLIRMSTSTTTRSKNTKKFHQTIFDWNARNANRVPILSSSPVRPPHIIHSSLPSDTFSLIIHYILQ
ncbi:hypothetical protein EYC84_005978 [Monilinia fructicola]|uniref:Uncharacterized protein n=1 Tax=Monilinia fructicola TaxID=38448 RepID=A0A5M9JY84_MONFR|nr:hypothetical protein EYC84_005978 [Monilinia fructicola]